MKLATRPSQPSAIEPSPQHSLQRSGLATSLLFLALALALPGAILLAVGFGAVSIPFSTIVQCLLNMTGLFHFKQQWDPSIEVILIDVRLPGVVGAALVGAALSVAGVLFQGMLRNPLADPYLLGTSSGAALGATIAFVLPFATVFGAYFSLTPLLAFLGALITVIFVYSLARSGGQTQVVTLILAGVVVNAVLTALQTLILNLWPSNDFGRILGLFNWLSGGISVVNWPQLFIVGLIVACGLLAACWLARTLDLFALGEEGATYLGLHVERARLLIVVIASLLTAAAVSISGLIGFVGLVTPHVMRLLLGPGHRKLIPASALAGAIFLVLADLLARTLLAPAVLPVGVFTALIGAPFFLLLLRNRKRAYRW
jgi:ABC-type Fe3+-siderophore transport system, permease component